jgi:hypothetical protein
MHDFHLLRRWQLQTNPKFENMGCVLTPYATETGFGPANLEARKNG